MSNRPNRIASSWQLMKKSLSFLANNKDLMILPVISLISTICLLALFLGGGIYELVVFQPK